jgi:hypothetical protein
MLPNRVTDYDYTPVGRKDRAARIAAFIQIDLGVGMFHVSFLASDKPLLSIASHTSSLNPPGYSYCGGKVELPGCEQS